MRSFAVFLLISSNFLLPAATVDTITPSQPLAGGNTLVSAGGLFELGFFTETPARSFLGIWFHNIPVRQIVWVANRRSPVTGPNKTLSLTPNGNLVISSAGGEPAWESNTSALKTPSLKLLDSGNLVLTDGEAPSAVWQSFDDPSHAFLPGMELGLDLTNKLDKRLTAWIAADDPTPGVFAYGVRRTESSELVIWNESSIEYRTGPWAGVSWTGIPQMNSDLHFIFHFTVEPDKIYYTYEAVNKSVMTVITLTPAGILQRLVWLGGGWRQYWRLPEDKCDEYGTCGAFGICNVYYPEGVCKCLRGFEPKTAVDWGLRDYSGGCKRKTALGCEGGRAGNDDGFVKVSGVKPPDTGNVRVVAGKVGVEECGGLCLRNCSCVAYVVVGGNCLWYADEIIDVKEFVAGTNGGVDVYLRLAAADLDSPDNGSSKKKSILAIAIPLVLASLLFSCFALYLLRRKRRLGVTDDYVNESRRKEMELPIFDMSEIEIATNSFSNENKLGEGGFGSVYMGHLRDGQEIAVKRLSRYSVQGLGEFMNEVMLIAKLQHRNLVRLLGCCIQKEERLLVYEYMPNKSLDSFIFDKTNSFQLCWQKRFDIILGIARGLLYLHQDSRLKIVHRDLKLSNVLLDKDLNPKISDFGMARIVRGDQLQESTEKVVGTYGYMSPEYAMHGIFSVKSDVFSFGVIVLEILTGKKNRVFDPNDPLVSLVGHAWKLWSEDRSLELVDQAMECGDSECEILRCMQVGLLCVQEGSDDRPTMASVVLMLGSEGMTLPLPKKPGFYPRGESKVGEFSTSDKTVSTGNEITLTMVQGR